MRYNVLINLFCFTVFINTYNALGISSKLDLDALDSPKIIGTTHYSTLNRRVKSEEVKAAAKTQNLGVNCVSGEGCNITNSNASSDSIETDVVVHVKTSVNLNDTKKSNVEDAPEVPILIGKDVRKDDGNVIVSPPLSTTKAPFFVTRPYSAPNLQSGSLYTQKYGFLSPQPQTRVTVEQIPSVSISRDDLGQSVNNIYKAGGQIHVPRFEPTFHRHYFQENPPSQIVWYPKASVVKPSTWSQDELGSNTHKHYPSPGVVCTCKNEVARGLQWHPKRPMYEANAGHQINDKLAPLE